MQLNDGDEQIGHITIEKERRQIERARDMREDENREMIMLTVKKSMLDNQTASFCFLSHMSLIEIYVNL